MKQIILTILAVFFLIIAILSSGIVLCIQTPVITEKLSSGTALAETAKFSRNQLVEVANKTREYVAGDIEKEQLFETIKDINIQANTDFKDYSITEFAAVSDQYSLNANCMSHLDDVKSLFANMKIAFGISCAASIILMALIFVVCGRSALGRTLTIASSIIIICMAIFAAWAIIDFNNLFNWLHSLFFKNGSWFFSDKSLLISMYPETFWIGMGVICVAVSFIASVILLFIGKLIK